MKAEITKIQGVNKVEGIYFKKPQARGEDKHVEYFLRPDVIIAENGLGAPKYSL